MSYEFDKYEFHKLMEKHRIPFRVTEIVLRDANTLQRLAVKECNDKTYGSADERLVAQCVDTITRELKDLGVGVDCYGDPRGCVVKVIFDDNHEYGVPTRRW